MTFERLAVHRFRRAAVVVTAPPIAAASSTGLALGRHRHTIAQAVEPPASLQRKPRRQAAPRLDVVARDTLPRPSVVSTIDKIHTQADSHLAHPDEPAGSR